MRGLAVHQWDYVYELEFESVVGRIWWLVLLTFRTVELVVVVVLSLSCSGFVCPAGLSLL